MLLKQTARIAVVVVLLAYLARSVIANWAQVSTFDWQIDSWYGLGSILCFALAYSMLPFIWRQVLRSLGHDLRPGDAWDIYFMGNLGRYVPGKVWVILGVSYFAKRRGIPPAVSAASAVLAQVYSLLSSVVFFFLFLIFTEVHFDHTLNTVVILSVMGVVAAVFSPGLLGRILNAVLTRLGKEPVDITIAPTAACLITAYYTVSWVIMGFGFAAMFVAVAGAGIIPVWQAASMYVVAYAAGFLALFAPGGIGVREGVLGAMLGGAIPMSVAILIAALTRLLVTLIELMCVGVTVLRKGLIHGETEHKTT